MRMSKNSCLRRKPRHGFLSAWPSVLVSYRPLGRTTDHENSRIPASPPARVLRTTARLRRR